MKQFIKEAKETSTSDILLILSDQRDLYTEEEIAILEGELLSRDINTKGLEEKELEMIEIIRGQIKEEKYRQKAFEDLRNRGLNGYYEYKVISLLDTQGLFNKNSGKVDTLAMTEILNELGMAGWRLATAYSNELGKNALSGGVGGAMLGINSTVDENILIFERFVQMDK